MKDNDLRKSPKKKRLDEKRAVLNAEKNRTTKNWVEKDLNKFPKKGDSQNVMSL